MRLFESENFVAPLEDENEEKIRVGDKAARESTGCRSPCSHI